MPTIDDLVAAALASLGDKPSSKALQAEKKRFSERMSEAIAQAVAQDLRNRGCREARPAPPGEIDRSGAERRMAGGLGAKKVDVTWATPEAGLLLGVSIKTINFKDSRSSNFQKNLINRRGDMLMEAVTLHRRFPYAVLGHSFFWIAGPKPTELQKESQHFRMLIRAFGCLRGATILPAATSSSSAFTYSRSTQRQSQFTSRHMKSVNPTSRFRWMQSSAHC